MQTRRTYTISIKLAWWGCCETVDISPCVQKTFCHAKHRGFFIGPGILSKHPQPQKVGWWVLSEKPGDSRGEENSGTCSQTKVIFKTYINSQITFKKKNYMKFIFNQRSGKNTQLNHSFYQHRPSQCTTRIASLLQRCGLVPPAASWTGPLLGHTIGPSLAYDHLVNIQKAIENCHL